MTKTEREDNTMAKFSITVPDDKVAALVDAFAIQYNYADKIETPEGVTDNPQNKQDFAKACIRNYVREVFIANAVKVVEQQRMDAITAAKTETTDFTVA